MHFLDISASKRAPKLKCFVHVGFQTRFAPQRPALFGHLNFQKCSEHGVLRTFSLQNVLRATPVCTFSTSQLLKLLRCRHFFSLFTSNCASRLKCFAHFDFQMCFAPQRCALFPHLNFQKSSEPDVLCNYYLPNVLRATTGRTFSTSQRPKVIRTCGALTLFTSKCASRHNGVQFFIPQLVFSLLTLSTSEFLPGSASS